MDWVILTDPIGTRGYIDPQIVKTKGVTHKSDIYAFGVILFEILCGRKPFIHNHHDKLLAPLAIDHYEKKNDEGYNPSPFMESDVHTITGEILRSRIFLLKGGAHTPARYEKYCQ
ncbi:putative protein kinase RLK-Pelle-LRR-I-1 family [Helianthus annuus]|uniref:Protein kinase domain-containing protein n=1 Tax=Helianthus annuus TaxID=4232 RepID=A0A9K3HXY7_HELAN|nr:putative protein kinase RLK-Pelle-LRR-I-1 family [Helianthus annuus]KAF5786430.1 putative protein kinase RLK-Pelle-LRR-I-1 family [Helianthus annuus]KAJ0513841.1 putative protein kinase RLK-Pelle-LRR-I-1 family [Helianthus annuus]KAJ0521790.1 putative protein kinase RLK-Pelle-LRR-I-1 family [Helianthus annuus]KAJ0521792.1 putative protein kinase RLK-Pelle-LRR-I-1 family [Helianthus annuus]